MPSPDEYTSYFAGQQGDLQNAYLQQISANTATDPRSQLPDWSSIQANQSYMRATVPPPPMDDWGAIQQRQLMIQSAVQTTAPQPPRFHSFQQGAMNFIPQSAQSMPYSPFSMPIPQGVGIGGSMTDALANQRRINAVMQAHTLSTSPMVAGYGMHPGSGISDAFPSPGAFIAPHLSHFQVRDIQAPQRALHQRSLFEDIQAMTGLYLPRESLFEMRERAEAYRSMQARATGFRMGLLPGIGRGMQWLGGGMMLIPGMQVPGAAIAGVGMAAETFFGGRQKTLEGLNDLNKIASRTLGLQTKFDWSGDATGMAGMPNFDPVEMLAFGSQFTDFGRETTVRLALRGALGKGGAAIASQEVLSTRMQKMLASDLFENVAEQDRVEVGRKFQVMIALLKKLGIDDEAAIKIIRRFLDEGVPINQIQEKIIQDDALAKRGGYQGIMSYLDSAAAGEARVVSRQLGLTGQAGVQTQLRSMQYMRQAAALGMRQETLALLGGISGGTRVQMRATTSFMANYQEAIAAMVSNYKPLPIDRWVPIWEPGEDGSYEQAVQYIKSKAEGGLQAILTEGAKRLTDLGSDPNVMINAKAALTLDAPEIVSQLMSHEDMREVMSSIIEGTAKQLGVSKTAASMMIFQDPQAARAFRAVETARKGSQETGRSRGREQIKFVSEASMLTAANALQQMGMDESSAMAFVRRFAREWTSPDFTGAKDLFLKEELAKLKSYYSDNPLYASQFVTGVEERAKNEEERAIADFEKSEEAKTLSGAAKERARKEYVDKRLESSIGSQKLMMLRELREREEGIRGGTTYRLPAASTEIGRREREELSRRGILKEGEDTINIRSLSNKQLEDLIEYQKASVSQKYIAKQMAARVLVERPNQIETMEQAFKFLESAPEGPAAAGATILSQYGLTKYSQPAIMSDQFAKDQGEVKENTKNIKENTDITNKLLKDIKELGLGQQTTRSTVPQTPIESPTPAPRAPSVNSPKNTSKKGVSE